MDEKRRKRRDVIVAMCCTAIVNVILGFFPAMLSFVWIAQFVYIVPVSVVFVLSKRGHVVAAMYIVAGVTVILDAAYCGYLGSVRL